MGQRVLLIASLVINILVLAGIGFLLVGKKKSVASEYIVLHISTNEVLMNIELPFEAENNWIAIGHGIPAYVGEKVFVSGYPK